MRIQKLHSEAVFSEDGKYRYLLSRQWSDFAPRVLFIMLNPSTADAEANDPTVKRCVDYAHEWGYGSIEVANLFALRSTDPSRLLKDKDPIGPDNLLMIEAALTRAKMVVGAWGNNVDPKHRISTARRVIDMVRKTHDLYALSRTNAGEPGHPLYLKVDAKPFIIYERT